MNDHIFVRQTCQTCAIYINACLHVQLSCFCFSFNMSRFSNSTTKYVTRHIWKLTKFITPKGAHYKCASVAALAFGFAAFAVLHLRQCLRRLPRLLQPRLLLSCWLISAILPETNYDNNLAFIASSSLHAAATTFVFEQRRHLPTIAAARHCQQGTGGEKGRKRESVKAIGQTESAVGQTDRQSCAVPLSRFRLH